MGFEQAGDADKGGETAAGVPSSCAGSTGSIIIGASKKSGINNTCQCQGTENESMGHAQNSRSLSHSLMTVSNCVDSRVSILRRFGTATNEITHPTTRHVGVLSITGNDKVVRWGDVRC